MAPYAFEYWKIQFETDEFSLPPFSPVWYGEVLSVSLQVSYRIPYLRSISEHHWTEKQLNNFLPLLSCFGKKNEYVEEEDESWKAEGGDGTQPVLRAPNGRLSLQERSIEIALFDHQFIQKKFFESKFIWIQFYFQECRWLVVRWSPRSRRTREKTKWRKTCSKWTQWSVT